MTERSDHELIAAVLAGEGDAFTALFARHAARLRGYLRGRMNLGPEAAEDVVQDTFEVLAAHDYAALGRFAGRAAFFTYLCAIATRRVYRLHRRQPQIVDTAEEDRPEPAEDPTSCELTASDVRRALEALPEDFRTALTLHHFGGLEYHEIASLLGVPENTIATRICRAKKRLRESLSG